MLGYLVHNEHVTRELEESGVALVAEPDRMKALEQVTEGTVIFTAHGISPAVVDAARPGDSTSSTPRAVMSPEPTTSSVSWFPACHHVIYIGKTRSPRTRWGAWHRTGAHHADREHRRG